MTRAHAAPPVRRCGWQRRPTGGVPAPADTAWGGCAAGDLCREIAFLRPPSPPSPRSRWRPCFNRLLVATRQRHVLCSRLGRRGFAPVPSVWQPSGERRGTEHLQYGEPNALHCTPLPYDTGSQESQGGGVGESEWRGVCVGAQNTRCTPEVHAAESRRVTVDARHQIDRRWPCPHSLPRCWIHHEPVFSPNSSYTLFENGHLLAR